MSPATYRARILELGLTQEATGELMGYSKKSGQRWAFEGPPTAVAMLLTAAPSAEWLEDIRANAEQGAVE